MDYQTEVDYTMTKFPTDWDESFSHVQNFKLVDPDRLKKGKKSMK